MRLKSLILLSAILTSSRLYGVSLNIGYFNPPVSTWGINLLWLGSKYGFEVGIGQINASTDDDGDTNTGKTSSLRVGGAISGKFFFAGTSSLRPYAQVGIGVGVVGAVGDNDGTHAGAGGLYGGVGLLAGSEKLYLYLSGNVSSNEDFFPQIGLGLGV